MTTTADNNAAADLLAVQRDLHAQAIGHVREAVKQTRAAEQALVKARQDFKARVDAAYAAVTEKMIARDKVIAVAATLGIPVALIAEASDFSPSTVSAIAARAKKNSNGAVTDKEAES
jgi:hypothetical protein